MQRKQFRRGWAVSAWFEDAMQQWRPVVHYFREQPRKPRWKAWCGAMPIAADSTVHSLTEIADLRHNGAPVRAVVCPKCRKKAANEAWQTEKREERRKIKELLS